jgi:hypothetical protein
VQAFTLSNLTLQGGETGVRIVPLNYVDDIFQLSGNVWQYVVFRNQDYGIHLDRIYGYDTNVLDNVSFINCGIGFFQDPNPVYPGGEPKDMTYVDKLMMYNCQFINNTTALSMLATRANNLNSFYNCLFDGNVNAVLSRNHPIFANCDFKNNTGDFVISSGGVSLYSCDFENNTTDYIFEIINLIMEGCELNDDIPMLADFWANPQNAYIINSTVTGDKGYLDNGIIANSVFEKNSTLSKLLVNIVSGSATTVINQTPTPYPQLLVKH